MRRAQSDERGNKIDAAIVGNGLRKGLDIFGLANQAQPIAQPLHDRAANKDAAFERVFGDVVYFPGDGGDQTIRRRHGAAAGVLQHEASGAVGILGEAGPNASLPEERCLLIAGDARERNPSQSFDARSLRRTLRSRNAP